MTKAYSRKNRAQIVLNLLTNCVIVKTFPKGKLMIHMPLLMNFIKYWGRDINS